MNSGPKGTLIMPIYGKEIQFLELPPKSWHKITQQQLEDILRSARGKSEFRMPFSPFMELLYSDGDMGTVPPQQWLLYERRNQAAELRKQITGLMFEFFFLQAPFGQYGPVAAFELYLYTAVDSRPGPGGSRTTASCQP